jgi:hypothetical protein
MARNPDQKQIVSPKGIAVFPRLSKPDTKFNKDGEYSIKLKLDTNDEAAAKFLATIEEAREASLPWAKAKLEEKIANAKSPADKGKAKKKIEGLSLADSPVKTVVDEDGNDTAFVEVRFKCNAQFTDKDEKVVKTRPALRGPKKEELDPAKVIVGGGSTVKVAALMYPYYSEKDNVSGVAFRLQAVQVIDLKRAGGGDFGFGEEDGDLGDLDTSDDSGDKSDASGSDDF